MKRIKFLKGFLILVFSASVCSCGGYIDEPDASTDSTSMSSGQEATRYSVSYYNYDRTFLYACEVYEGGTSIYKGPEPVRPSTEEYDYTFTGWSESEKNVQRNMKLYAQFSSTYIPLYNVSFLNYDSTLLYSTSVRSGKSVVYLGETPTRPSSLGYEYTFIGWDKSLDNIRSNTTFIAKYSTQKIGYKVSFLNYDDSLLDVQYTDYGYGVTYQGSTPERPSSGADSYVFSGWDTDLSFIVQDTEVHALYNRVDTYCKVVFMNYNDQTLYQTSIKYGSSITYPYSNPSRPSEGRFQYVFDGWDKDLSAVYKDMLVYPKYRQEIRGLSSGFSYSIINTNEIRITGYSGSESDVYIPSTLVLSSQTYKITEISSYALQNKTTIKKLYIDENVRTIGDYTFSYCSNLKDVTLPNSLETIGEGAFIGTSVREISILNNCRTIGKRAFPNNISTFLISSQNPYLKFEDRILYNYDKTTVYYSFGAAGNIVLPNGVETIESYAFENSQISSIFLPSSIKKINSYAFTGSAISSLRIDNASCTIYDYAFSSCGSLRAVDIGDSVVSIGSYAFSYCSFTSFTIPGSLLSLSSSAFSGCSSLQTFIGPSTNTFYPVKNGIIYSQSFSSIYIIPQAFVGTLYIPKNVNSVNFNDLGNSYSLTGIEIDPENATYLSFQNCVYNKAAMELIYVPYFVRNVTLHDNTLSIADYVCSDRTDLLSVTFNSKLQYVGNYSFSNCYNASFNALPSTIRAIRSYAFRSCNYLTSANLGNSCTQIGACAFQGSGLTSLQLGNNINNIGEYAFSETRISSVTLPDTVTTLGSYAFSNCSYLTTVDCGDGLTSLPSYCFYYCTSLATLTLPYKLTTINNNCFTYTSSLRTVTFPASIKTIGAYAFQYSGITQVALKNTAIASLGSYAFASCQSLTSVTLGSNIVTIPNNCFSSCSSLNSYDFPTSITTIGSYAFSNTGIGQFNVGSNVTSIGDYAFQSSAIHTLTINSNSLTIGQRAFYTTYLRNISFGSGTVTCYSYSFYYCSNLTIDASNVKGTFNSSSFYNCSVSTLKLGTNIVSIGSYAFGGIQNLILPIGKKSAINSSFASSITYLYYLGTPANYDYALNNVSFIYYFSSTQPTDTSHTYWHYVNNTPTIWVVNQQ